MIVLSFLWGAVLFFGGALLFLLDLVVLIGLTSMYVFWRKHVSQPPRFVAPARIQREAPDVRLFRRLRGMIFR